MKAYNLFFLPFLALLIITSCQQEDDSDQIVNQKVLTSEHKQFLNAWEVNPDVATIEKMKDIDGVYQDYIVSHDIEIPMSEFDVWKSNKNSNNPAKQYTSRYTVASVYRNITVVADPSLSRNQKSALAQAVERYNQLGTSLKMTLNYSGIGDIKVIPSSSIGQLTGKAGFPDSSGRPYPLIRIQPYTYDYPVGLLKPIFMHELGHCIGLRHQDFRSRSSCSNGSPEPGYVAHIPGTPVSDLEPSIMLACMRTATSTIIDFTDSDILALNTLY